MKRLMLDIFQRRAYSIHYFLECDRAEYLPVLIDDSNERHDENLPAIIEWCRGFMKAFAMNSVTGTSIFNTPEGRALINPFVFFGTTTGWSREIEEKLGLKWYRQKFTEHMAYAIYDVKAHFTTPINVQHMGAMFKLVSPYWRSPSSPAEANWA